VYEFIDVKFSDDTILQPDVLIVCKPILKNFLDFPAALVIEILSPATALKDRNSKFFLYEKMGIKYFLIIDIDKQSIEIYTLKNRKYQLTTYNIGALQFFLLNNSCKINVELDNIWE